MPRQWAEAIDRSSATGGVYSDPMQYTNPVRLRADWAVPQDLNVGWSDALAPRCLLKVAFDKLFDVV